LESPNELQNVEDAEESWIREVPKVTVAVRLRRKGEMLESDECDKSSEKEQENQDVDKSAFDLMQKVMGIVEEDSLYTKRISIEPKHAK